MDATFSLDLSEEVVQVRDWVHEFAESVIRPAAAEWDEREETPWPIIQEAAKVGLYTPDLFAQMAGEASGLGMPTVFEEMFWGDAGIALSIMATGLAAAALAANGTPQQIGEWLPQMFGSPGDPQLAAFCSSEPGAGSDVGAVRTRARYDEASDEWVLNGTKTWATNGGIANVHVVVASVEPELGTRGQATFIVPPGTKGLSQGQKFKKHGIRASHTAEVVLDDVRLPGELILGGREKFERRIAKILKPKQYVNVMLLVGCVRLFTLFVQGNLVYDDFMDQVKSLGAEQGLNFVKLWSALRIRVQKTHDH